MESWLICKLYSVVFLIFFFRAFFKINEKQGQTVHKSEVWQIWKETSGKIAIKQSYIDNRQFDKQKETQKDGQKGEKKSFALKRLMKNTHKLSIEAK